MEYILYAGAIGALGNFILQFIWFIYTRKSNKQTATVLKEISFNAFNTSKNTYRGK